MSVHERLKQPIKEIISYSTIYKANIQLDQPLWTTDLSDDEIMLDIIASCSRLELLCTTELKMLERCQQIESISKRSFSVTFESRARLIVDEIHRKFDLLSDGDAGSLSAYFRGIGIDLLFPCAVDFLDNPDKLFTIKDRKSLPMIDYFEQLVALNQVIVLSHQLRDQIDVESLHKYTAHQIALLYNAIIQLGPAMDQFKVNIQDKFGEIKKACQMTVDDDLEPILTPEMKAWILNLAASVIKTVHALPSDATVHLQPFINYYLKYIDMQ